MPARYQAGAEALPVRAISQVETYGAVLPNRVTLTLCATPDAVYRTSAGNREALSMAPNVAATPRQAAIGICPRMAQATVPRWISRKHGTTRMPMVTALTSATVPAR